MQNPEPARDTFESLRLPPFATTPESAAELEKVLHISTEDRSPIATTIREVLSRNGSAEELINALKNHTLIAHLYEATPPSADQYRLDDHSHAVIRQFDKYFGDLLLPGGVRPQVIRLTLALHDIGKYIPESTAQQHAATVKVIRIIRDDLPVNDEEFSLMVALIDGDPIGQASIRLCSNNRRVRCPPPKTINDLHEYCRTKELLIPTDADTKREAMRAIDEIKKMSETTSLSVEDFTRILVLYYQCDSSAYSVDGELMNDQRAHAALEFLYKLGDKLPSIEGETLLVKDSAKWVLRPSDPFIGLFEEILSPFTFDRDFQH